MLWSPLFLQSSKPLRHHTPYFDGVPPANSTFYQQPAYFLPWRHHATGGSVFWPDSEWPPSFANFTPHPPHAMREPVLAHTKMSLSILQLFAGLEYFFLYILNYISSCLQVVNINIATNKGQGLYQSDFLCVSIQFKTQNSESAKMKISWNHQSILNSENNAIYSILGTRLAIVVSLQQMISTHFSSTPWISRARWC